MLKQSLLRFVLLPGMEWVSPARFWSLYRRSIRLERQGEDKRSVERDRRLNQLFTAARHSALYQPHLALNGVPGGPSQLLSRVPVVTKADIRRHYPDGILTSPSGPDWQYLSTSGTTDRLTVVSDFAKRDQRRACELRVLKTTLEKDLAVRSVEIPPNACNVVCGLGDLAPTGLVPFLRDAYRRRVLFRRETLANLRGRCERGWLMVKETLAPLDAAPAAEMIAALDAVLDRLEALRPTVFRAYPLYLLWLADRSRLRRLTHPYLRLVAPYGGLTTPQMADRIRAGFGAPFADVYGSSELGSVAAGCGRSPGMHLFDDLFVVEVGDHGRILITDLVNTVMPLIRYQVGDVGRLHTGPCPCGRRTPRLEVLGRLQEVLTSPGGPVPPAVAAGAYFADPAVANVRIDEIDPGYFRVAVVARPDERPDLAACETRFRNAHGAVRKLDAKLVPLLRPESSGKYRFVWPHSPLGG
jgi:phenylacetate-CoA ligase